MATSTPLQPAKPLKFDTSDVFVLTNEDEHTITFRIPHKKFVLEPGQRAFVPFNLVRIYFGDPRSIPGSRRMYKDSGGEGTIPTREFEVDRLKTLYGVYGEDKLSTYRKLEDTVPKVTIQSTTGTTVITPAYDRTGELSKAYSAKSITDLNKVEDIAAVIEQHERQLDQMRRLMDKARINGPNSEDDVEEDMAGEMDL